jgi:hypothetical protein
MDRQKLDALLLLSGIKPVAVHEVANKYWPDDQHHAQIRRDNPWWLVLTKAGPVVIGWRKRVISIDWTDTQTRTIVTVDEVTKNECHVHACNYGDAVKYLAHLAPALNTAKLPEGDAQ